MKNPGFSSDTQVLTRTRGFVPFYDLDQGEELAEYDRTKGEVVYGRPMAYHSHPVRQQMYRIKHKNAFDLLVTRGHHCLLFSDRGFYTATGERYGRYGYQMTAAKLRTGSSTVPLVDVDDERGWCKGDVMAMDDMNRRIFLTRIEFHNLQPARVHDAQEIAVLSSVTTKTKSRPKRASRILLNRDVRDNVLVNRSMVTTEGYQGKVYTVTNKTRTVIVRRNGLCCITGSGQ